MQTRSRTKARRNAGLLSTVVHRFHTENVAQTAAALAFTTLLSLVPLVTLIVSLADWIPFADLLVAKADGVIVRNLLPLRSGETIAGYILQFARQAKQLTLPGLAMLAATAFVLLHTIERAFNHLWEVGKPRPILERVRLYAVAIVIWPLLLGGVAALLSYAVTVSLGFVGEMPWARQVLIKGTSVLLLGVFFAFLYYAVPNYKVGKGAALAGSVFATLAFALMQKGFELYLTKFGTFASVYGAFAAAPIFLLWLHLSWTVVLVGGLIAAKVSRPA